MCFPQNDLFFKFCSASFNLTIALSLLNMDLVYEWYWKDRPALLIFKKAT